MRRVDNLNRTDWKIAAAFFVVGIALCAPFRTHWAYLWDSAEFTLAINDYNVALSQPHPPGYFLYVMLARWLNAFVGDPHVTLVWISVIAGGGLAAVMYLLGASMFGRISGVATALLTVTSPLIWFHSCVALTYVVDALGVSVLVLWCWRARERGGTWMDAVGLGLWLALLGGVRQQTVPGMLLLVAVTFWSFQRARAAKALAGFVAFAGVTALWFSAMLARSGGWTAYHQALGRIVAFHSHKTLAGGGLESAQWNVVFTGLYLGHGMVLGAVLLLGALVYAVARVPAEQRARWRQEHAAALRTLALWIVPPMILGIMVGYTEAPGHVFIYLPGWLLVVGAVIGQFRRRALLLTVVTGANIVAFLAWPARMDSVWPGTGHTARELRQHEALMARTVRLIGERYPASSTMIVHVYGHLFYGLRHLQLYLPDYEQYQLQPDLAMVKPREQMLLAVRKGCLMFADGVVLTGKTVVLLVVPPGESLEMFSRWFDVSRAQPVGDSAGLLYVIGSEAMRPKR